MRFFGEASGSTFTVREDHPHIAGTLRMKPGDEFTGIDGSGSDYACTIREIKKDAVICDITGVSPCAAEPRVRVTLYQAYPKLNIDIILQKCTELGLFCFVPFISERCVKRPSGGQDKLRKIARAAVKQCGRSRDVDVLDTLSEAEVIRRIPSHKKAVLCYEEQDISQRLINAVLPGDDDIAIIIGPEGGFSPDEAEAFIEAGAVSVSLGRRILKAETAGIAAMSVIMHICGEL